MRTVIGNQIRITNPSEEIQNWCRENLILDNPEYTKKVQMGFWIGKTPKKLKLFMLNGETLILPYGCLKSIMPYLDENVSNVFQQPKYVDFGGKVPLHDYQEKAVEEMIEARYGILQSPAGSGKTQMGIAIAEKLGVKTLWLTHTKDLLNQSKTRAEQYIDPDKLGTITEGLVNIGESMTFATIQTMCKVDLTEFRDEWDCVIVDECHRVSGTPTAMTQFSYVLNRLRARHKYGLSATVHRADGMIKATYAYLGEVAYKVPEDAVKDRVMTVEINPRNTGIQSSVDYLNWDGTINYPRMISYLTENNERNQVISKDLLDESEHYNLILSERVNHLKSLYQMLPTDIQENGSVIDGKSKKEIREKAIQDMRDGKKHYLFATYALCKEGLDIPRLDRLYLATPQKDYAIITQSIGRVARTFDGKDTPIVYDYVDEMRNLIKAYKKRCAHYRKAGCVIDD